MWRACPIIDPLRYARGFPLARRGEGAGGEGNERRRSISSGRGKSASDCALAWISSRAPLLSGELGRRRRGRGQVRGRRARVNVEARNR